jgi:hypothetical protein
VRSTVVWIELSAPPAPIATATAPSTRCLAPPKVVAVVLAERVPEAVQLAAD